MNTILSLLLFAVHKYLIFDIGTYYICHLVTYQNNKSFNHPCHHVVISLGSIKKCMIIINEINLNIKKYLIIIYNKLKLNINNIKMLKFYKI